MSHYEWLNAINNFNFEDKSVLIIGAGNIAKQYTQALSLMNVNDLTILSRSANRLKNLSKKYNFKSLSGGFEKHLSNLGQFDLVVVATPIDLLIQATESCIKAGQTNILIEKPVSINYGEIESLARKITSQKVRVGYNRLVYPNFHKLQQLINQEGGITSASYSFTEWIHRIDFSKYSEEILQHWGIANSLHVISMAHNLIGFPADITAHKSGQLSWHPSGTIFTGIGITKKDIPFSYHSDWTAPGRWSIEIMTQENTFSLKPLEKLFKCPKNSVQWEEIPFNVAYPAAKQGITEEIAIMLDESKGNKPDLVTLDEAASYCKLAEKIFGYEK